MKNVIRSTTGALLVSVIAAGCSTSPPASEANAADTALTNASQAIDHAAADPQVAKYASSELDRASESLQKAKAAWSKNHDLASTRHFSYMAQQRAATAQELANGRAAEEAVTVAALNRDHALSVAAAQRRSEPTTSVANAGQAPEGVAGFAFNISKLPPNAQPAINELAARLKNNPEQKVVIEGHTDNSGDPNYNRSLALERAQAVRSALVRQGIDVSRITVRSLGEENPIASNDTKEGRRENRRAQVIIGGMETMAVGSSQGGATASGEDDRNKSGDQHAQSQQSQQQQQQQQPPQQEEDQQQQKE
jgi:outer membrane protein OmpA-like peptidoglycan-associated protein